MKKLKKPQKEDPGYWVHCLRCNRTSRVQLVAKCGHCGSYAVRMITKGSKP